jgi:hypothetical protein
MTGESDWLAVYDVAQIEHHLLPGLSHGVLRRLSPVIRDTCREFHVDFKCVDSFGEVVGLVHEYFEGLARNKVRGPHVYLDFIF